MLQSWLDFTQRVAVLTSHSAIHRRSSLRPTYTPSRNPSFGPPCQHLTKEDTQIAADLANSVPSELPLAVLLLGNLRIGVDN